MLIMNKSNRFEKIALIFTYLLSSMLTTVINKYVVSNLNFKMLFFYLTIQSSFTTVVLYILHNLKIISIKPLKYKIVKEWTACSFLLVLMIYTGTKAMQYLQISLFTLFKNFGIIVTSYFENIIYGQRICLWVVLSFILMIVSSGIGEYSDFNVTFYGYAWSLLNVISTSSYQILLKFNIDTQNCSNHESLFYCNLLSLPFLIIGSLFIDIFDSRISFSNPNSVKIYLTFLFSSIFAMIIAYSTVWCLKILSSTSLGMLGATNKLLVSISGIVFLGEQNVTVLKGFSLLLGSLSSLIYLKRIKDE